MLWLLVGVALGGFYTFVVVADALRWGLPRWRRVGRIHCDIVNCNASFHLGHGVEAAMDAMDQHCRASHQDECAEQLWPRALPTRNRDFSTRQARVMQERSSEDGFMVVGGMRVRLLRGGKNGGRSSGGSQ